MSDSKSTEELREGVKHSVVRFRKYLAGPVPSDLLYGSVDKDPQDVIIDEIMRLFDQELAKCATQEKIDEILGIFVTDEEGHVLGLIDDDLREVDRRLATLKASLNNQTTKGDGD